MFQCCLSAIHFYTFYTIKTKTEPKEIAYVTKSIPELHNNYICN